MTLFVDIKFAKLLSHKLQHWKIKQEQPFNAQFRCPLCGDSKKHSSKTRGYFYVKNGDLMFKCWNCGASNRFKTFLKKLDSNLYDEYLLETINPRRDEATTENARELEKDITKIVVPNYLKGGPLNELKKISQLAWDHPAKKYVESRCIPNRFHNLLFYCPKFYKWTNSIIPNKFRKVEYDEPRLIIPFINGKGQLFAYQGRSFDPNAAIRYITITLDSDQPKIYGIDRVNFNKHIYVVEGPIDSMFIDNCLAMASAGTSFDGLDKNNTTFVFDNEPRNIQIVEAMERKILQGYAICILHSNVEHKVDINDLAIQGKTSEDIKTIIDKNTYTGLQAQLRLAEWRKCTQENNKNVRGLHPPKPLCAVC